MKLFISDLHLGSPLFDEEREKKVLELLDENFDEVYILGDLISIWENNLSSIINRHTNFLNKLRSLDRLVIIRGNHDPSLEELIDLFPNAIVCTKFVIEELDTLLIHGDEFDSMTGVFQPLVKVAYGVHWVFERLAGWNLKALARNATHYMTAKFKGRSTKDLVLKSEEAIVENYGWDGVEGDEGTGYTTIICGHTHLGKYVELPFTTYINTGSIINSPIYVIYDGEFKIEEL